MGKGMRGAFGGWKRAERPGRPEERDGPAGGGASFADGIACQGSLSDGGGPKEADGILFVYSPADPLCGQICMGLAVPAFIWDPDGFLWIYQELEWSGSGSYDVLVPPDPAASLRCRSGFSLELCSAFGPCPQVAGWRR